jgi:hypothetical protein
MVLLAGKSYKIYFKLAFLHDNRDSYKDNYIVSITRKRAVLAGYKKTCFVCSVIMLSVNKDMC